MSERLKNHNGRRQSLGIYLHVPFCKSRCAYCDFISSIDSFAQRRKYVEYLQRQIDIAAEKYGEKYNVDTLYMGGGTPTLLDSSQLKDVTDKIYKGFQCNLKEFTAEANPCTVDNEKLTALKDCGVGRLSIGVQSFDNALLKMLGRRHDAEEAKRAVKLAKSYGFDVSVDAMIGLPGQKILDIKQFVDIAADMDVDHISVYMLSVERGTALDKNIKEGKLAAKCDDEIADDYQYACEMLAKKGYSRYEISNFCRDGKVSYHNLRYWQRCDYLGLGMGAHSLIGDERWRNAETFDEYYNAIDNLDYRFDVEPLSVEDRESEFIMLNFRLTKGIDFAEFTKKFGSNFLIKYKSAIEKNKNYLQITSHGISIKYEYLQLMNSIAVDFV